MKLVRAIVALSAIAASAAFASEKKEHGGAPNCEITKGKKVSKIHAADEAACTKKKGKWVAEEAAPAAAPAEAAPAAAPAGEAHK